jgi:hypothetical protein
VLERVAAGMWNGARASSGPSTEMGVGGGVAVLMASGRGRASAV